MEASNTNSNTSRLAFIGLYAVSVLLIGVILSAIWGPVQSISPTVETTVPNDSDIENEQLLIADRSLHQQLDELYTLHIQYSTALKDTSLANKESLDSQIVQAEAAFHSSLDSLDELRSKLKSAGKEATILSIKSSFSNVLNLYKKVNTSANTVVATNGDDKNVIAKLNDDVAERNQRIKELESQLKASEQNKNSSTQTSQDAQKLAQENKFLSTSLRDIVFQNGKLTKANNQQKQTIEKLNKQVEAFRKFTGAQ